MTILIVSHSWDYANATKKYIYEILPQSRNIEILVSGGTNDKRIGTDTNDILKKINLANHKNVLVICDLGSAILSSQVAKEMTNKNVHISNGSFIEGLFASANLISANANFQNVIQASEEVVKKY